MLAVLTGRGNSTPSEKQPFPAWLFLASLGSMNSIKNLVALILGLGLASASWAQDGVYFENIKNHAKVPTEFLLKFGVKGMTVKPAGTLEEKKGHHHVIVDGSAIAEGTVIPMDATHLHFGKGQTENLMKLAPGKHTLTLQFANGSHASYGPKWSKTIHVEVEDAKKPE